MDTGETDAKSDKLATPSLNGDGALPTSTNGHHEPQSDRPLSDRQTVSASQNERTEEGAIRSRFTKWAIFTVTLSLLPISAKFLGSIIKGDASLPGFDELLGDGELLVVATVIAAAGIGDILFEGSFGRRVIRAAIAMTLALLVVIVSVMLYGFASLQEDYRKDAEAQYVQQIDERNQDARDQIARLRIQEREADERVSEAQRRLDEELTGSGGTRQPGTGSVVLERRAELEEARAERDSLRGQSSGLQQSIVAAEAPSGPVPGSYGWQARDGSILVGDVYTLRLGWSRLCPYGR